MIVVDFAIMIALVNMCTRNLDATDFNDDLEEAIQDYCPQEVFQPQCPSGDVILMKSAVYGRMRIGRCITKKEVDALGPELRAIGCSVDVLEFMDGRCSRKTECSIRTIEVSLETTRPCLPEFLSLYLEASYACIKTVADEKRSCSVDVVSSSPIHIVNWKTSSCGMSTQPWTVIAPIGQRIIISRIILKTTAPPLRSSSSSSSKVGKVNEKCSSSSTSHMVIIVDKAAKRNSSECTSGSEREEEIYSSTGNSVDVYLRSSDNTTTTRENNEEFILKFQAVGCSDIIPPSDAYFKREGETVVVGCYVSRKTWHLYCDNGKWIGVIGNCSQGKWEDEIDSLPEVQTKVESMRSELVLWIVAIGGFAVSICLAVICFGAVFLKRKRFKSDEKREYKTLKHQFNPFENQRTMIESGNGRATVIPVVNDAHCSTTTQPTYSVFVGDGRFKDDNDQVN